MSASGSTVFAMIETASSISLIERSGPPIILKSTPFAPSIETSSKGEEIACFIATKDLFSPEPTPIPIKAVPALLIIAFTSAKSTLISPGTVINSAIPLTP